MQAARRSIPLWFVVVFVPMVLSQIIRLHQTSAVSWLICDYAGRIGALLLLAAIPAARVVAFRRRPLLISWWETMLWIILFVTVFTTVEPRLVNYGTRWFPHIQVGHYPSLHGGLRLFDLTAGLALVACQEEIVFRRCAREVFAGWGDAPMIGLTAFIFAAYHWWSGIANMIGVFVFGVCAMLFLKRTGALWPIVLAHFLVDLIHFS